MCQIIINQPIVGLSGSTITSVTVTGSIGPIGQCSCDVLHIVISCLHGTSSNPQTVPISWNQGNGTFTATFSGSDVGRCLCDKEILVRVTCNDGVFESKAFKIECEGCRLLNVTGLNAEICKNTAFQFQVAYVGGGTTNLTIDYGDGTVVNIPNVGSSGINVPMYTYTQTGNYTIVISFNGIKCEFPIKVKDCDCCPIANTNIQAEVDEKCNKDLTKRAKIDVLVTPTPKTGCPPIVQAELYIDNILVDSGANSSPFTLSHSGDYACGNHDVTIKYPGSGCPDSTGIFCVSVCESKKCKKRRFSFEVSATISLIALVLYLFNSAYTLLAGLFTASLIAAIILYLRWRPCDKICKKCPWKLALWQILLASFLGFIMLSKSSFIKIYTWLVSAFSFAGTFAPILAILVIIIVILLIILIVYLLYKRWVSNCCPTECEKWTNILESLLDVCGIAFVFVGGFIFSTYGWGVAALFWIPYASMVWALIVWLVKLKKIEACTP
ncbi:MAG TPA: hypothetical protein VK168_02125 [Saprospiraceae bacterium]|nr:hypothetical protein [Saprospiraceae bacterium]